MKSMPISKYFEVINPEYVFYKLTPLKSLRNYNSDKIINAIASLYKTVFQRISKDNKKYFFTAKVKISYYIFMEKGSISFYFILPKEYETYMKEKIKEVWRGITVEKVSEIPTLDVGAIKYCMNYKKQDAFSLAADKRNNALLTSIVSNAYLLESESDKLGVFFNFIPTDQKYWRGDYDYIIKKYKEGYPVDKQRQNAWYLLKLGGKLFVTLADLMTNVICEMFHCKEQPKNKLLYSEELQADTRKKRDSRVVKTQILVMSQSENKVKANLNAVAVCESFKSISGDNELKGRKMYAKNINLTDCMIKGADCIKTTPNESQNFLSLPGKDIIEEYKIHCIDTIETEVPAKLRTGYISLGINTCRGNKAEAFLRDNYDQGNFPLVTVGEQGAGKTTYMGNYIKYIQSRGEGAIIIDFIKNCELSDTIIANTDKDKLIVLDMSDIGNVQGIGYNELIPKSNKVIDIVDTANRKALYVSMLIDALNTEGEVLSSSMDRFLSAASNIVFLDNNASLKDIVRCLNDYTYRNKCIENLTGEIAEILDDEINALKELDETNKNGEVIGTKTHKIDGINHRINLLRKDLRLKMMFQKSCKENIDLVKAMDEGKIIVVKMLQEYFPVPYSKNVIVTYLFTKIWAAELVRGSKYKQPKRFHIAVDEVFQAPTAMQLLRNQEILPQTRKFGAKFVFSCQRLEQLSPINQTLKSAGASYMLMKGSAKANFNEFKEELAPYTLEDIEAMQQYDCLNIINYEEGKAKFITHLPKPLK